MHNSLFRRVSAVVVVAGLAIALAACSSSGSKGATKGGAAGVVIANFKFSVSPVKAGSTVTVTNNDTTTHTVTADDGASFNVRVNAGKSATFTAPAAGSYKFHCSIHRFMKGTLTVT
jgi:plastocyanin